jgi:thioredoxin-like negative regulator of GroEL
MKPTVSRLEQEYEGRIEFVAYNIDETSQDVFNKCKFIGRPQFVVLNPDGEIVSSRNGMVSYEALKADLEKVLAAP